LGSPTPSGPCRVHDELWLYEVHTSLTPMYDKGMVPYLPQTKLLWDGNGDLHLPLLTPEVYSVHSGSIRRLPCTGWTIRTLSKVLMIWDRTLLGPRKYGSAEESTSTNSGCILMLA